MKRLFWGIFLALALGAAAESPLSGAMDGTNRVAIVNSGYDALLLRVHLFRNAQTSIHVQTFILTNDECGRLFMYELIQAAKRGVKVRMIADHIASDKDRDLAAFLADVHPNLELKYYRPMGGHLKPSKLRGLLDLLFAFRNTNQRMHNKVITEDGKIGITGGRNIENTYYHFSSGMNFKDRDVLLVGPEVRDMEASFEKFWECRQSVAGRDLADVHRWLEAGDFKRYETWDEFLFHGLFDELSSMANDPAQIQARFADALHPVRRAEFICDRPGKNSRWGLDGDGAITERLRKELESWGDELVLQSPYLVLNQPMRNYFERKKTENPNLKVKVSSNSFGATDNIMAYSASYKWRSLYMEDLGFHIYEYKPLPKDLLSVFPAYPKMKALAAKEDEEPYLCIHAKSFVMDDRVAYIGTFNLDPRSANLNTEVGLLIEDPYIAALLKADILNDMKPGNSWVIAKKQVPLSLDTVNDLLERASCSLAVDVWPVRNTSCFELMPGQSPLPPDHPDFYARYQDVGSFPEDESLASPDELRTRVFKVINGLAAPIL